MTTPAEFKTAIAIALVNRDSTEFAKLLKACVSNKSLLDLENESFTIKLDDSRFPRPIHHHLQAEQWPAGVASVLAATQLKSSSYLRLRETLWEQVFTQRSPAYFESDLGEKLGKSGDPFRCWGWIKSIHSTREHDNNLVFLHDLKRWDTMEQWYQKHHPTKIKLLAMARLASAFLALDEEDLLATQIKHGRSGTLWQKAFSEIARSGQRLWVQHIPQMELLGAHWPTSHQIHRQDFLGQFNQNYPVNLARLLLKLDGISGQPKTPLLAFIGQLRIDWQTLLTTGLTQTGVLQDLKHQKSFDTYCKQNCGSMTSPYFVTPIFLDFARFNHLDLTPLYASRILQNTITNSNTSWAPGGVGDLLTHVANLHPKWITTSPNDERQNYPSEQMRLLAGGTPLERAANNKDPKIQAWANEFMHDYLRNHSDSFQLQNNSVNKLSANKKPVTRRI